MSSQAKIDANRQNAKKSTGPKTASGKAASARNATSHGLSTATLNVLPTEDPAELDRLSSVLIEEHQPKNDAETFLVEQMIQARWKLARIQRLEGEAFDRMLESGLGNADRQLISTLERPGNVLDKLERYRAAADRMYFKAFRELQQLRANAAKTAKQNKAKEDREWLESGLARFQSRPELPDFTRADLYPFDPSENPQQNEPTQSRLSIPALDAITSAQLRGVLR